MSELSDVYTSAIEVCEQWRSKVPLSKATPNEIRLYNIFTHAQKQLKDHLACIEDVEGTYK
jgi:hypothetical protein